VSLTEALRLERAGDSPMALRIYGTLLQEPGVSPDLFEAFRGYFRLERDLAALLDSSREILQKAGDKLPKDLAMEIAALFELCGDTEGAYGLYIKTAASDGFDEARNSAALLSIEMNDIETASGLIRREETPEIALLAGRVALQRSDLESARSFFGSALRSAQASVRLQAMYGMYAIAVAGGNSTEIFRAAEGLSKAFPLSPEASIIAASRPDAVDAKNRIIIAPVPAAFLASVRRIVPGGDAPAASESREATGSASQKVSVQAGSFKMRVNADDMALQLSRNGFSAVIREAEVSGTVFYKVLAFTGLSPEQAQEALSRLRAKGFDGVLVSE
jgi:hypothetical protein